MPDQVSVLFVCLGNICRSPTAEGVFRQLVTEQGMTEHLHIDSCGTGNWHIGKSPDARAMAAADRRGVDISDLRARQIKAEDLDRFDYVLVMDRQNLADVRDIWHQNGGTEPRLFLEFGESGQAEVPDPYYGGEDGFERVLDLIHEASQGLLEDIRGRLA
ncbi:MULTISPECIES: low molecular weight protein-tyrosine-phosphatase [Marinobacter]|jgi:protein-tyrosine phosphatase|uniref:protein-tyrosine-phosphatase n=3 Tax=Marinobacter TaxID=2742 RepID=A0A137SGY5_9GAMM|nr:MULTISPECIES: low molecular weight protein-tyrosine-phosphatase [Marinobacter]MDX5439926.1 low molecular weight phosphotyrosine protein phosphatase [Alteromonadaceae bacterium]WBU42960.1 low molecular weight phosphotyrosine protein phosphatase [Marinobacter alkaliphilus]AMQ90813.1 phosphotyrosine protein phosphatase [Marinobacter sp. LQ44]KXO11691.1 Low molecular weight protein tyrosine phosphatase [Marinobacter excellens LAMA 842]MAO13806.1 low molecular weight phosphotyrosine protein phos